MSARGGGWIGVDFDGTLATYERGQGPAIGQPIPAMVERIKAHIAAGHEVRIVTARVARRNTASMLLPGEEMWDAEDHRTTIQFWCKKHLDYVPQVTAEKDFQMWFLYDDRAVSIERNTGRVMVPEFLVDSLTPSG